ncbi:MAG: hypothetical protein U0521_18760 [Anaerolineae bacterium]
MTTRTGSGAGGDFRRFRQRHGRKLDCRGEGGGLRGIVVGAGCG